MNKLKFLFVTLLFWLVLVFNYSKADYLLEDYEYLGDLSRVDFYGYSSFYCDYTWSNLFVFSSSWNSCSNIENIKYQYSNEINQSLYYGTWIDYLVLSYYVFSTWWWFYVYPRSDECFDLQVSVYKYVWISWWTSWWSSSVVYTDSSSSLLDWFYNMWNSLVTFFTWVLNVLSYMWSMFQAMWYWLTTLLSWTYDLTYDVFNYWLF